MSESIETTLQQRGERYGRFEEHARISQLLKDACRALDGWERLSSDQRESIEMILHKLARIFNGDPNYDDSWRDIAGYAQLVCNRLTNEG